MEDSVFNHSRSGLAESVIDAIEIIADKKLSSAKFDRTIQATILSCTSSIKGEYKCQYQNSKFLAYSSSSDITFNDNTLVYILIPGNDWDATKTILGTVDKLGANYESADLNKVYYDQVGCNVFDLPNSINNQISINTWEIYPSPTLEDPNYNQYILRLYDKNDEDPVHNILHFNQEKFNDYFLKAEYFKIAADFRTSISPLQSYDGSFGLRVGFINNSSGEIDEICDLNSVNMIGSIRQLTRPTTQYIYYKLPKEEIKINNKDTTVTKQIGYIEVYIEGYTKELGHLADIFITNFDLSAQYKLTAEQMTNGYLSIYTPAGRIKYTANNPESIILEPKVRLNGAFIDNSTKEIKYYWFKRDARVFPGSSSIYQDDVTGVNGWIEIQGTDTRGWRCMNSYSIDSSGNVLWDPDYSESKILKNTDLPFKSIDWKCIAIYNGLVMEQEITIENRFTDSYIEIVSSNGTEFFQDRGETVLTCQLFVSDHPGPYNFYWGSMNTNGDFTYLDDWYNLQETPIIPAKNFKGFKRYICTVYSEIEYIGSAIITLSNLDIIASGTYYTLINGGNQTFKYDANGVSPTSNSIPYEKRLNLQPLSISFFAPSGAEVEDLEHSISNVKWRLPKNNTLLLPPNDIEPIDQDDNYYYYGGLTFVFNITENFKDKANDNQVNLSFEFGGAVQQQETNFVFLKDGQLGTNGTDYYCLVMPNIEDNYLDNRILLKEYSDHTLENPHWEFIGWDWDGLSFPFKVKVYKNNQLIYEGSQSGDYGGIHFTIDWEIYNRNNDLCLYEITKDNNIYSFRYLKAPGIYDSYLVNDFRNLIRAKVTVGASDSYILYNWVSITVLKSYLSDFDSDVFGLVKRVDNNINIYSGFLDVQYDKEGQNPIYGEDSPYNVYKPEGNYITKVYKIGNVLIENYIDDIFTEDTQILPTSTYNGYCTANAIIFRFYKQGSLYGLIYIPLIYYLNRYGLKHINDWDGTNIVIDTDGKYLLAPQVGAGHLNNDHTFTGAFIGDIYKSNGSLDQSGIFALGHGVRSFEVNAETGKTIFGIGQDGIIIDPGNTGSTTDGYVRISGGGWETNHNQGMVIDFKAPYIKWGNGNFEVNQDGLIVAIKMNLKRSNSDTQPYYSIDEYGLLLDVGENPQYDPIRPPSAQNGHKVLIYNSEINPADSKVNGDYKTNAIGEFGKDGIIFQSTRGSFFYMKDINDYSDKGPNTTLSSANALYLRSGMLNNIPDPGPADEDAENYTTEASVTMKAAYNANIWAGHGLSLRVTGPHDRDDPEQHQNWPPAVLNSKYGYMKLETQYGWIYLSSDAGGKKNTPGIGINAYTWKYRQEKRGESENDPLGTGTRDSGTPYPNRDYKVYINGNEVLDAGNAADATGGDLGGAVYVSEFGNLRPYLDNLVSLGSYYEEGDGIAAWRHVVTYDTIQVSDKREKTHIQDLDKRYIDLIMSLRPKKYKYLKTREDEYRTGFIAQEVETCLDEVGLRNKDFGGLKKKPIIMNGETVDYGYGLNYDDFVAALVLTVQDLQKQINDLKGELKNGIRNVKE